MLSVIAPSTSVLAEEARKQRQAKKLPHCAMNMTITAIQMTAIKLIIA